MPVLASKQDIVKGLDLTGEVEVSASEINQVTDTAAPYDDKGLVITTTDVGGAPTVPDASADDISDVNNIKQLKWQRYFWRRLRAAPSSPLVYFWNPNADDDATLLKWRILNESSVEVVATMAQLKAIDHTVLVDGQIIEMTEYYVQTDRIDDTYPASGYINDRGGGKFIWRAACTKADDGGYWIKPTSNPAVGRWERVLQGTVPNIRMWGAIGDGSTDDTDKIQAAFSWVTNNFLLLGSEMYMPMGEYVLTDTVILPFVARIYGEGSYHTKIRMDGRNKDAFKSWYADRYERGVIPWDPDASGSYDAFLTLERFSINYHLKHDVAFDVNNVEKAGCAIVIFNTGEAFECRNLLIQYAAIGIKFYGSGAPGPRVMDCSFANCWTANIKFEGPATGNFAQLYNMSSDRHLDAVAGNPGGIFVWLDRTTPILKIQGVKVEGNFSSGFVKWDLPEIGAGSALGQLTIENGTFNSTLAINKLVNITCAAPAAVGAYGIGGQRIPKVKISQVRLYNFTHIIHDQVSDYSIYPYGPYSVAGGLQQNEGIVDLVYEGIAANSTTAWRKRILSVQADARLTHFRPVQAGWYRIASQNGGMYHNCGNFTVHGESAFVNFDVTSSRQNKPCIRVNSASFDGNIISRIRVVRDPESVLYNWMHIDIYVENVPNSPYAGDQAYYHESLFVTHRTGTPFETNEAGFLCKPTLLVDADIDWTGMLSYSFDEVKIRAGLVISSQHVDEGHLTVGRQHLWAPKVGPTSLQTFDEGVEIVFVRDAGDTTGSGAEARAIVYNGVIERVVVLNHGANYTQPPRVFAIPREFNIGAGAVLTAVLSGNTVSTVTVVNGGAGYGAGMADAASRHILADKAYGTPVVNARTVVALRNIALVGTSVNSRYLTGAGLLSKLFPGDILFGPNNLTYEVDRVANDTTVILTTAYPDVVNDTFTVVGYQLFPAQSGYAYIINGTGAASITNAAWAAGGADRIQIRSRTENLVIGTILVADLNGNAGGLNISKPLNGIGKRCAVAAAIEIAFVDGAAAYRKFTAGGNITISAHGTKVYGTLDY